MKHMVALVEDVKAEEELLRSYFERYSSATGEEYEIRSFHTGREFLFSYQPVYDMVLMDIQLPDISGMDAALALRKEDSQVVLVFVTSLVQYAVKGYEAAALDFLVKPVSYPNFERMMKRAVVNFLQARETEVILRLRDGVQYRVSPARIRYIEIQGHSLLIHTVEGNLEAYGSLNRLEKELDPGLFARCHRSFLVNLDFVRGIKGQEVLVDQETLPVAKLKRESFLQALNRHIGKKN